MLDLVLVIPHISTTPFWVVVGCDGLSRSKSFHVAGILGSFRYGFSK